jgi:CRP/FNR family transcriptional regulator
VGTFKALHIAEDGYEQVLGFAGRGEVLGYDALCQGLHPTTAVALEDSTVYALALPDVFALFQRLPALDRALHLTLSRQLMHQVEIANLMAAVSAEVRLARFLVQLSERMAERGQSPRRLLLRMSRRDIASHIGVAHETVSRSFGVLMHLGCLAVCNREVEILDLERLKACASNTRGLADSHLPHGRPLVAPRQAAYA